MGILAFKYLTASHFAIIDGKEFQNYIDTSTACGVHGNCVPPRLGICNRRVKSHVARGNGDVGLTARKLLSANDATDDTDDCGSPVDFGAGSSLFSLNAPDCLGAGIFFKILPQGVINSINNPSFHRTCHRSSLGRFNLD